MGKPGLTDLLEARAERSLADTYHAARLLAAFGHEPAAWEWTGETIEQDPKAQGAVPCACGHEGLRWLFPWKRRDGKPGEVITGSVCVNGISGLEPGTVERMQAKAAELLAEVDRRRRVAAQAAKVEAVVQLAGEVAELVRTSWTVRRAAQAKALRASGPCYLPEELYSALMRAARWEGELRRIGQYQKPGTQLRALGELREWIRTSDADIERGVRS